MRIRERSIPCVLACLLGACGSGVIPGTSEAGERAAPLRDGAEQIRARRLFVAFSTTDEDEAGRSEEDARERAELLAGMAHDHTQSFQELVTQYGDRPPGEDDRNRISILDRGETGLSDSDERRLFRLRVGQTTRALRTEHGFAIYRREADEEATPTGPSEIGARHILIGFTGSERSVPGVTRNRAEARALAQRITEDARREGADWNALHAEYSDEPSGRAGGDLGTFGRGQMVRAFERAAFALEVDEIAGPVESPFGFHVIQRTR